MLRFLADENFNADIVRAAVNRRPSLNMVTAQAVGLDATGDPAVLEWCAGNSRILLTHDVNTMPGFAYARVRAGLPMPGVFAVAQDASIRPIAADIVLLDECSIDGEWEGQVRYLPL